MRSFCLILFVAGAVLIGFGCETEKIEKESVSDTGSVLTDKTPLLLSNDQGENPLEGTLAGNARCYPCHINYAQEELAVRHERAGIGCKKCHGESDAHIADESWAMGGSGTPPEIMYPRPKINPACMSCHTRDKIDILEHKPLFADNTDKVCTDCHGNHRLPHRNCKWK
jgi:hypothetical protein